MRRSGVRLPMAPPFMTLPAALWSVGLGVLPDPIAALLVVQRLARHSAVVPFIPTDGVKDEPAFFVATILVGLAGDDVIGQLADEAGHQRLERLRELAVGQPMSFQRTSQRSVIGGSL